MTTQIVFNIDPKIKAKAMKRAKAEGIPFAVVLKLAAEAFAEGKLNVGISQPEHFNTKTARELRAALKDIKNGKNVSKGFTNIDDAIMWLDKKE